jgi:hypothetical protein
MRFLIFAGLALATSTVVHGQNISPEVFKACELKHPVDYKQQLACVNEQESALNELNKLKQGTVRQIKVAPKPQTPAVQNAEEAKDTFATPVVSEPELFGAEDYCGSLHVHRTDPWHACVAAEAKAKDQIDDALKNVNSDIPGDIAATCLDFTLAFQKSKAGNYIPQVPLLNCVTSKAPTRVFARCYENFVGEAFNRDVKAVPKEQAKSVALCFNSKVTEAQ